MARANGTQEEAGVGGGAGNAPAPGAVRRFSLFAIAVALAAVLLSVLATRGIPTIVQPWQWAVLGTLIGAVVLSELLAVTLPNGSSGVVSISYPLAVAVFVFFGAGFGIVTALASCLPFLFAEKGKLWSQRVFNVGQVVLAVAVPGLLYQHWGRLLMFAPITPEGLLGALPPLVTAATLGAVVNCVVLMPLGYRILYGRPLRKTWGEALVLVAPPQLVMGVAGIAIAQVASVAHLAGLLIFTVPLILARQAYSRSAELQESYADTVKSMVGALEARDSYTRGHSERVAIYAVLMAQVLGWDEEQVTRLRYAALLHDIGKTGISLGILSKESRLSDDEYDAIKRHPGIGAHILADVPHLQDVVPSIASHHERFDGRGYGDGLAGEDIPLAGRLLAVADSYDAMTSLRAYHAPMTHAAAMDEIRRGSGGQFDPLMVEAFERTVSAYPDEAWPASVGAAR